MNDGNFLAEVVLLYHVFGLLRGVNHYEFGTLIVELGLELVKGL